MTSQGKHTLNRDERQATLHELLQEQMRLAIRNTLITILEEEVNGFIQAALYQRTPERQDQRNGHYERDLVTTSGMIEDLPAADPQRLSDAAL
jgi:transposase-like protein